MDGLCDAHCRTLCRFRSAHFPVLMALVRAVAASDWKDSTSQYMLRDFKRLMTAVGSTEQMRKNVMKTHLAISAVLLSAAVSVETATACSKEAVADAVERWTAILAENNPDTLSIVVG